MRIQKILLSIFFIIINNAQKSTTKTKWSQHLINYIQVHSRKYQIFLIANNDEQDFNANLVFKIQTSFPTQHVNFHCIRESPSKCLENHQFFINPRGTNLFIIIPSLNATENLHQTTDAINVFNRLSGGRTRPKWLVIFPNEEKGFSYKRLLRKMWSHQVLDATVLIKNELPFANNYFTKGINEGTAKLIQYNPFLKTKQFFKSRITSETKWFPNKLHNLHETELNVSLFSRYPLANVTRNASGYVIQMSGRDANIIRFMAEEMNFSINMVPHNYTTIGRIYPYGNQSDGVARMLENNTLSLVANSVFGTGPTFRSWAELTRGFELVAIQAVVPIQKDIISSLIITKNMSTTLVICIAMIFSMLILARIFKLDKEVWQPFILFQILFGFGVSKEPKQLVDRIIFASLLITSLILSMNIYEVCTDISLNYEIEKEMNSLDDLLKSGLKTKISESIRINIIENADNGSTLYRVLDNAEGIMYNKQIDCLEELANYRNVCCLLLALKTEHDVDKYKDESGNPIMKVIPEIVRHAWYYMYFERGSPFVSEFDRVFQLMSESGIYSRLKEMPKRWYAENTDQFESKEIRKVCELLRYFFLVFLIENCLTIVIFLLERFIPRKIFSNFSPCRK